MVHQKHVRECIYAGMSATYQNQGHRSRELGRTLWSWLTIAKSVSRSYQKGCHVKWTEFHREHKHALRLVELPSYSFDLKNYWLDYQSRLITPQKSLESATTTPFSSICLKQIEKESFDSNGASVVFTSDFSHPELSKMVRGHLVCGIGLCPSSVYAEMAFTAARYIFCQQDSSIKTPPMDLSDMEIFSPFMLSPEGEKQIFRVTATQVSSGPVGISFHSQVGAEWKEHARCQVSLCDGTTMMEDWNLNAYLIRARSEELEKESQAGLTHNISRKMAYKLFNAVVNYSEDYQALQQTFMSDDVPEASAILGFKATSHEGNFTHSPFWIDSLAQLGGFCLNVNPPSGEDDVYISHGWKSMRVIGQLSHKEQYRGYVRMQPTTELGVYAGNVYMFNDNEVVAVCAGLKFKQMKRSLLRTLLGVSSQERHPPIKGSQPSQKILPRAATVEPVSLTPEYQEVIDTIALEAGLDENDLSEDAQWSDLGIDSILTISILRRLRTLTSMELPSSLFATYSTVGKLENYFQTHLKTCRSRGIVAQLSSDSRSRASSASTVSSHISSPDTYTPASIHTPPSADIVANLRSIIIEELGIQPNEAQPTSQFSDLGLDSLLSISVLGSMRERTGVSLPSSFFSEYQVFSDLDRYTRKQIPEMEVLSQKLSSPYKSKAVLLQGVPTLESQALFLLPDGSGSALSYIDLPVISKSLPVYALFSPFHECAKEYVLPFETVASIFVNEIRSLQPQGPYLIAGWSMGGIFAYEVARQILDVGEEIELLMFIDSPCPRTLPPLPAPTLDILENSGLFDGLDKSGKGISKETRQHFLASVRTLEHFNPVPLEKGVRLKNVIAIWAKDGMLEGVSDQKKKQFATSDNEIASKAKEWLFGLRSDYGPAGWDKLVMRNVDCHVVKGNHFSIVKAPQITAVGDVIKECFKTLGKC